MKPRLCPGYVYLYVQAYAGATLAPCSRIYIHATWGASTLLIALRAMHVGEQLTLMPPAVTDEGICVPPGAYTGQELPGVASQQPVGPTGYGTAFTLATMKRLAALEMSCAGQAVALAQRHMPPTVSALLRLLFAGLHMRLRLNCGAPKARAAGQGVSSGSQGRQEDEGEGQAAMQTTTASCPVQSSSHDMIRQNPLATRPPQRAAPRIGLWAVGVLGRVQQPPSPHLEGEAGVAAARDLGVHVLPVLHCDCISPHIDGRRHAHPARSSQGEQHAHILLVVRQMYLHAAHRRTMAIGGPSTLLSCTQ